VWTSVNATATSESSLKASSERYHINTFAAYPAVQGTSDGTPPTANLPFQLCVNAVAHDTGITASLSSWV